MVVSSRGVHRIDVHFDFLSQSLSNDENADLSSPNDFRNFVAISSHCSSPPSRSLGQENRIDPPAFTVASDIPSGGTDTGTVYLCARENENENEKEKEKEKERERERDCVGVIASVSQRERQRRCECECTSVCVFFCSGRDTRERSEMRDERKVGDLI